MTAPTQTYLITWSMDVEADGIVEAATKAWIALRRAESIANCFEVQGDDRLQKSIVDLQQQRCRRCGWEIHVRHVPGTEDVEWLSDDGFATCSGPTVGAYGHQPAETVR